MMTYEIGEGDSYESVALQYGVNPRVLRQLNNGVSDPIVGQVLNLPVSDAAGTFETTYDSDALRDHQNQLALRDGFLVNPLDIMDEYVEANSYKPPVPMEERDVLYAPEWGVRGTVEEPTVPTDTQGSGGRVEEGLDVPTEVEEAQPQIKPQDTLPPTPATPATPVKRMIAGVEEEGEEEERYDVWHSDPEKQRLIELRQKQEKLMGDLQQATKELAQEEGVSEDEMQGGIIGAVEDNRPIRAREPKQRVDSTRRISEQMEQGLDNIGMKRPTPKEKTVVETVHAGLLGHEGARGDTTGAAPTGDLGMTLKRRRAMLRDTGLPSSTPDVELARKYLEELEGQWNSIPGFNQQKKEVREALLDLSYNSGSGSMDWPGLNKAIASSTDPDQVLIHTLDAVRAPDPVDGVSRKIKGLAVRRAKEYNKSAKNKIAEVKQERSGAITYLSSDGNVIAKVPAGAGKHSRSAAGTEEL